MQSGCGTCGWPNASVVCEACGASSSEAGYAQDADPLVVLGPQPEDFPQLKNAFLAWQQRDYPRMVGQCLLALGVTQPQIASLPIGPGWSFHQDSALVCLAIDKGRGELAIESPMVRVPETQRVPLLRSLLELNARALGAGRFCLRGDTVVLRYADRLENVSPPKLMAATKEIALKADRYDDVLRLAFGARMIGPEAKRHANPWTFLGTPRNLMVLKSKQKRTEVPAPPVEEAPAELDAVERLLEIARTAQALGKPLLFARRIGALALVHRAAVFRSAYEARMVCPDAVQLLFAQASLAYASFFDGPPHEGANEGASLLFDAMLARVLEQRGQVGPQPPISVPMLKSALEAKTLLRAVAGELERAAPDPETRHHVLLGMLCELTTRAKLTPAMVDRVTQTISAATKTGPTARALLELTDMAKGLTQ